jgi:hypothetical protein
MTTFAHLQICSGSPAILETVIKLDEVTYAFHPDRRFLFDRSAHISLVRTRSPHGQAKQVFSVAEVVRPLLAIGALVQSYLQRVDR